MRYLRGAPIEPYKVLLTYRLTFPGSTYSFKPLLDYPYASGGIGLFVVANRKAIPRSKRCQKYSKCKTI